FQRTGLLEVQGYVGAAAILSLLMSTLMADNRRVVEEARESRVRFEAALLGSRHVMYVYDPASGRIAWEGEVASVLGRPSTGMGSLEGLLSCVHPEDREALRAGLALRASGEADAEGALIYRLGLGRDEWLTVADTGSAIADTSDTVYLVTGLLRRYVERGL
ncbi:PAS domain-containing protein, partial [Bordetella hinzii]|nr:PAS domain-containing protein [Bordetella hinzii]